MKHLQFLIIFLTLALVGFSQEKINQFDAEGKRHGVWQKKYEGTDIIRYRGTFNHGKQVGQFKFYHKKSGKQPSTIKTFNDNNEIAEVKHYTSTGKLVSEGKMDGRNLIGEWIYYQRKNANVLTVEHYNNGVLDGERKTYYPNKQLAEQEFYKDGKLHGERKVYSEKGVLIKHFNYVNGKLDGKAMYYDADGNVIIDGKYRMSKRISVWKYYENGKLVEEKDYTISKNPYKKKKKS